MNKKADFSKRPHRTIFFTGLVALLPTLITIFILVLAFRFLNNNLAHPLGLGVLTLLELVSGASLADWKTHSGIVALIGFPLTIIMIFVLGYVMATFIGRKFFKAVEKWFLKKFPIVNTIYPYAEQFTEILFTEGKKTAFKMVVAVPYPRRGLYTLGFVTSAGLPALNSSIGKECVSVFFPSSPTPFTGYTIFVPRDDIIPLKLSVDEALRIIVSGGILIPPEQLGNLKK